MLRCEHRQENMQLLAIHNTMMCRENTYQILGYTDCSIMSDQILWRTKVQLSLTPLIIVGTETEDQKFIRVQ